MASAPDPRMRFIRSKNQFDGLEDYQSPSPIDVTKNRLIYLIRDSQLSLGDLNGHDDGYGSRARLGRFFEVLTQGIKGGKIGEQRELNGYHEETIYSEPDITQKNEEIYREVKAVAPGKELKLTDAQIYRYLLLQTNKSDILPKITFEVFRHNVRNLLSNFKKGSSKELVEKLATNSRFMISLPFSAVYDVFLLDGHPYASRYEGDRFGNMTRLKSRGLNNLIAYPEDTFDEMGLDPNDFIFEKRRFPRGVHINDHEIDPFPILKVHEVNPAKRMEILEDKLRYIRDELERMRPDEIPFEVPEVGSDYKPRYDGYGGFEEDMEEERREIEANKILSDEDSPF